MESSMAVAEVEHESGEIRADSQDNQGELEEGFSATPIDQLNLSTKYPELEENSARRANLGTIPFTDGPPDHEDGMERQSRDQHEVKLAMKMADAVEDDARAVAKSLMALISSLKCALSEVTTNSVENMRCESEAAGLVQNAAINAATKGNRFINACLRLNEEMKGMGRVASQIENLKQKVDHFESQASRYLVRQ